MLNIILLILLILGFLIGLKRGFILQVFHLAGFIVAFLVALLYYRDLGDQLELWIPFPAPSDGHFWSSFFQSDVIEGAFYYGISFFAIFFTVKILMQIIANLLDFVAHFPVLHSVNNLLGAIVGFIEMYLIIFVVLFVLSLVPSGFVQDFVSQSSLATFIIEQTPVFSEQLKEKWFTEIERNA
ncbi:hypothetical protein CEY16_05715 [Halalkalibacillus sediminis]|uniref:CvpA family protein n=1 Tax=Halalkalibacillus sediminis TaxID=2018042 RepID=A0A2I0QY28_9BACI|nr:CvpA family protein [Halalkalibacillus sediminis]PKR79235.1 hypothetical protein CEY16_05715 [Halalkalibacillus sediminis]